MRKVKVSQNEARYIKKSGMKTRAIKSFFPIDHWDCVCQPLIKDTVTRFSLMMPEQVKLLKSKLEIIRCPKKKDDLIFYKIYCADCQNQVGECWAKDKTMKDYCDLHYVCENNGEAWKGAMTINISPIDGKVGFECCCGQDTRDFRANMNLAHHDLRLKIAETSAGRAFAEKTSKFYLK